MTIKRLIPDSSTSAINVDRVPAVHLHVPHCRIRSENLPHQGMGLKNMKIHKQACGRELAQCMMELVSRGHGAKESERPLILEEVGEAREHKGRGVSLTSSPEYMPLVCSELQQKW